MPPRDSSTPPSPPALRAKALLETLTAHEVEFLLIGGVAERLWGSPRVTDDLDICAADSRANLRRLAAALNALEAQFRPPGAEAGVAVPEPWDDQRLRAFTNLALTTRFGWLDVWFRPDGTEGYRDLVRSAGEVDIGDMRVKLASLDDIIRSKQAAGGTKYLTHLPLLRELRERRGR